MTVSTSQHHAARPLAMPWERRGRPALTGAWWVRGMRLDERAAGWPDAEAGFAGAGGGGDADIEAVGDAGTGAGGDADAEAVADIRFRRWRDAFADLAPDALDRQAAEYGGTPEQLRALLAEPAERLAWRLAKPAWARDVERIARTAGTAATRDGGADVRRRVRWWARPRRRTAGPQTRAVRGNPTTDGSAVSPASSNRSCARPCAGSTRSRAGGT
jgi:hypothetical protein